MNLLDDFQSLQNFSIFSKVKKKCFYNNDNHVLSDFYSYYLTSEKGFKETDADIEASKVHSYISKKIAQIKEMKTKAYQPKTQRKLLGAESADEESFEKNNLHTESSMSGQEDQIDMDDIDIEFDLGNGKKILLSKLNDSQLIGPETIDDNMNHMKDPVKFNGPEAIDENQVHMEDPLKLMNTND